MLISFIIPSYNSASTVRRCLDSIFALPLEPKEFEVIFIDDCSTDNTCAIVEQYATRHPNIVLLQQTQNNRQGAARNRGISVAQGEYIAFVDSDDSVAKGMVTAIRMAKEKQTDMTAFHCANANESGNIISEKEHLAFPDDSLFTGIELQNKHPYWCTAPWGYLYNRAFLSKVNYPFAEGVLYEDSDFVAVHLYYAERMTYSPALGYIAYYREGSTTHSVSYKNTADYMLLGTRMLAFYTTIQPESGTADKKQFADNVLEGAVYNITMSLKRIYRLSSYQEIVAYYARIDSIINRHALSRDHRIYAYPQYWTRWARYCLRHKHLSIVFNTCLSVIYRLYIKLKVRQ